jgi:23S rRNA-intervening sequence protein
MAFYENLPIYKKSVDLALCIEQAVRGFPRYHKYAIGADMRHLARTIAALIIKANSQRDKTASLTELRDRCEEMKFLITLGKEIKAFTGFKQFQAAAGFAVDLSRQSEGWLGSQKTKRPGSPAG